MKKLFIALALLMVLAGCGQGKETATTYQDELISSSEVIVATSPDYPPYESIDESSGEIVGFDIDLMNKVAELLGLEIKWQAMEFSTIVSAVQTGQVDLGVSGFSYDPEKQVAFSDAYYSSSQTILYLKDDSYDDIDDFKGKKIAAQLGTTCYELMSTYEGIEVVTGTDAAVLVEALRTGAYDGVCLDTPVASNYIANNDEFSMLEPIAEDSYSIITASDNTLLIEAINDALNSFMLTDEYQDMLAKWGID